MQNCTLAGIRGDTAPLSQNRRLFEALRDEHARARLYQDLQAEGFPPLVFKSVLRHGSDTTNWPSEDVYLLTARDDIEAALRHGSVAPYAGLDSGGRFMLGQDEFGRQPGCPHSKQRKTAITALQLDEKTIKSCVDAALERTMVLPQKGYRFDLVKDIAQQAALRLMALVFGLPAKSHVLLEQAMHATYTRLTFQIIGRHFVPDDGQPPADSDKAKELKGKLEAHVHEAAATPGEPQEWWDKDVIAPGQRVIERLAAELGETDPDMTIVALGLIAGTVGNVTSAIANTIDHFFGTSDDQGARLIDHATRAARRGDIETVKTMVDEALRCRPPAPFLARTAVADMKLQAGTGAQVMVPAGAHLLLAMGAEPPADVDLLFGGAIGDTAFPHNCVGRHLAWPLIYETVRQVLMLPGLAREIDPATQLPTPLVKRWGAICESFPLSYQRDRRICQQQLFLVLPIKAPVGENAKRLELLTRAGAPVIERALRDAQNVHFAWFGLVEGRTHLAMFTVYDGDFNAYVEHFALKVPLFDEQFKYLEGAPPTPVRLYPKEFVDFIHAHDRPPVAGYFYSAYPQVGVASILGARLDQQ